MPNQSLYDFSPIVQLILMGALVALGPLLWIGLRHQGATPVRRLQALTMLALFLTFDLTLFGAFTRLTDSGLGCPDWPRCFGGWVPPMSAADLPPQFNGVIALLAPAQHLQLVHGQCLRDEVVDALLVQRLRPRRQRQTVRLEP